jgi:acyl-homoserine lactone synthase
MLAILRHDHAPSGEAVLKAMFAARKSVFVDLLKWDVQVVDGRYEVDQFDDAYATYLVLMGAAGEHLGSARLLQTTRPHILGSLYPALCADAPPTGPHILEITRFCLDRRLRAPERRRVRDTLVAGLVDHALQAGITAYSAVAEMGWLQQILSFGWRCAPLGLPQRVEGKLLGAIRIDIDGQTPARLAAAGITPMVPLAPAGVREAA